MIVVVPEVTPLTRPVALFTEATVGVALVQLPPLTVLARVVVAPTHTVVAPDMVPASGSGLTVTVAVAATVPQLPVTL